MNPLGNFITLGIIMDQSIESLWNLTFGCNGIFNQRGDKQLVIITDRTPWDFYIYSKYKFWKNSGMDLDVFEEKYSDVFSEMEERLSRFHELWNKIFVLEPLNLKEIERNNEWRDHENEKYQIEVSHMYRDILEQEYNVEIIYTLDINRRKEIVIDWILNELKV